MKVCTGCPQKGEQPITNFGRKKGRKSPRSQCRECERVKQKMYRDMNTSSLRKSDAEKEYMKQKRKELAIRFGEVRA